MLKTLLNQIIKLRIGTYCKNVYTLLLIKSMWYIKYRKKRINKHISKEAII